MSNTTIQLLLGLQQAGRTIIYANLESEVEDALIELAIACRLEEDDCQKKDYMVPVNETLEFRLWCSTLTNLNDHAKQYFSRTDKKIGIHIAGDESSIPGPRAAFEHLKWKLNNNRHAQKSAYAHIFKHIISDIASRFVAVDEEESPERSLLDDRFYHYFRTISKVQVSEEPAAAIDAHFSRIVPTNSTNDDISSLVRELYTNAVNGEEDDEPGADAAEEEDEDEEMIERNNNDDRESAVNGDEDDVTGAAAAGDEDEDEAMIEGSNNESDEEEMVGTAATKKVGSDDDTYPPDGDDGKDSGEDPNVSSSNDDRKKPANRNSGEYERTPPRRPSRQIRCHFKPQNRRFQGTKRPRPLG